MKPREDDIGRRVGQLLEQRTQSLGTETLARLSTARRRALDALTDSGASRGSGRAMVIAANRWIRFAAMTLALAAGAGVAFYWMQLQHLQELEAIDSALLADDLPPNAFIDPGFRKWLERASTDSAPQ